MERDEEQKLAQNQSANPLCDLKNSNDPEISRTIEVLEELDNNELTKMLSVVMEKREVHIGPIPSAKELAAYKKVDKNAPGEIIGMAKERLRASIKNERTVTVVNCVSLILGQVFGALIVGVFMFLGFWLLHEGKDGAAFATFGTVGAALAGAFVIGKVVNSKSCNDKNGDE